ncbi:MAG: SRPBCC family protein [Polyangiales bacterium]
MKIHTQAVAEYPVPREKLFEMATAIEQLSSVLKPEGPLPGVERAWIVGGGALKKGSIRRVVLTDGTPLDEEITDWEPPRKHAYNVKGFRGPFGLLVKGAHSQWIFSPIDVGTRISWRYEFELTSPAALPLALPLVKVAMKRMMESTLANLRAKV